MIVLFIISGHAANSYSNVFALLLQMAFVNKDNIISITLHRQKKKSNQKFLNTTINDP